MSSATWTPATFAGGTAHIDSISLHLTGNALSIESQSTTVVLEDPAVLGVGAGVMIWANADAQLMIVTAQTSFTLYLINLESGATEEDYLFRDEVPDLRFIKAYPTVRESLLMLYERGILLIDSSGTVRWHRLHDDISADLIEVSSEHVVLQTQWPQELAGARHAFRLEDGQEIDEP